MTLKPPTKTFPKLVMKEWPANITPDGIVHSPSCKGDPCDCTKNGFLRVTEQALSDFTRVLEGVEGQRRSQKEGFRHGRWVRN